MIALGNARFRKNFIWNLLGTSFNAFNSLFFMIIVTRINGMSDSGIFTLAFSLACLLCIIGGYEGRVFQVTDIKQEFNDKEYIIHRFITTAIMMIIALSYTLIMGYGIHKIIITMLLCMMKALEVIADVFYGILQKNDSLYKVGYSLTVKSIASVASFLLIDLITQNLMISCVVLVLIWLALLIFYDIPQALKFVNKEEQIKGNHFLKLFKSGFFAFSILFLSMYLINAPKYALDGKVSESLLAVYGIILMPATVISLCAQYLLQPFLPKLSDSFKIGDKQAFRKIIIYILCIIIIIGIFALLLCYLFGIPVLNIIYGVSLDDYLYHLLIIIFGAVLYSLGTLFSTALTTIRKTFIQFIIYVIASIFGLFISVYLIDEMGILGAAIAYLAIMLVQFMLYCICYLIIINKIDFDDTRRMENEN